MSRSRILSVTAALALAAVPAVASAHGGSHHESDDHGGAHHRHGHHHRHAHHRFSQSFSGTVSSFTGGVLTITLADGSTRSAKVTARTIIRCHTAPATAGAARHGGDDPSGDDRRGSGSGSPGSGSRGHEAGDDRGDDGAGHDAGDDHGEDTTNHDAGDDHGTDASTVAACDSSALVSGVAVRHAVRHGFGVTATWHKLIVIR